jgi:hypothetical protein
MQIGRAPGMVARSKPVQEAGTVQHLDAARRDKRRTSSALHDITGSNCRAPTQTSLRN